MNKSVEFITEKRVERTMAALKKNQIQSTYVQNLEGIYDYIDKELFDGAVVSVGGSVTLFETQTYEHLKNGRYHFLNRYEDGLTKEDIRAIYLKSFDADGYFASANAITEDGLIYNVDGSGNRVAAIAYGPKKVFLIVGVNKIVSNLDAAIKRNEEMAAPANAVRLNMKTPCQSTGICNHCKSTDRICCTYNVTGFQRDPNRIHVILVNASLGF